MRLKIKALAVLAVICLFGTVARAGDDTWLHIMVEEDGRHGETVKINLPFELMEALAPLLDAESHHGDVTIRGGRIRIDCEEFEDLDLKAIMQEVRKAKDGEFITVKSDDEYVRVAKEGDRLLVRVDDYDEHVNINIRLEILEEMLKGEDNEIDLPAMVKALRKHGEGELVSVESDEETVRIWIDSKSTCE